jgi:hypothetical protein
MKIEWNKVTWYSKLIAVILFTATFYLGFNLGKESEKVRVQNEVLPTEEIVVESKDGKYCFAYNHPATNTEPYKTSENISLEILGDKVSGSKSGTQEGPDMTNGYQGSIEGSIIGDSIEVVFSYVVEGSAGKELEMYELKGDSLKKLRYQLKEGKDMLIPDKDKELEPIDYDKVNCK